METYIFDWLQLVIRWAHVITGVAWIGASFYFVWLDNHLQSPPKWKDDKGISGDLWAIHGGGVYEIAKYKMAPEKMPETLHWFKWEAYSTWLTGMMLLVVVYYVGAEAYLIDPRVANLNPTQAIAIGLAFILGGWFLYDTLCNSSLAQNDVVISCVLLTLLILSSYALSQIFSGRGAYIHVGAMIGTMMTGNVFRVIMPSQRALVTAIENGTTVDPSWGAKAKLRSTHNTYLTLPLLFIMISNHYPMTYSHEYNWLILLAICGISACARRFFVLRHKQIIKPSLLIIPAIATLLLAAMIAPWPEAQSNTEAKAGQMTTPAIAPPTMATVTTIIEQRCASCHSDQPSDDVFLTAPGGVVLDTEAQIRRWAPRILARAVSSNDMPFMNKTEMTSWERQQLRRWIETL